MKKKGLLCLLFLLIINTLYAQKPKVVILGVGHSTQLINYHQQPAAIRAFINKVKPTSICIERSPEEFSKNDFYEFTYEQQYVIIPFAKQKNIPLHPIDWLPSEQDTDLGFGLKDLETPKFIRQKTGFLGFTAFTEENDFEDELYFADDKNYIDKIASWYSNHQEKVAFDFPRRLFLYRTFLQSKRIQKVLEKHNASDTVLVVIGAFHKNDIEKNLQENGYEIIQPSFFEKVTEQEIRTHFTKEDAYAILSSNLLGIQSHLKKVNDKLVASACEYLKSDDSTESQFFKIRNAVYYNKITSDKAIKDYLNLLKNVDKSVKFTWTGVKDNARIDSYIDPFGNLTIEKRTRLELAREYIKTKKQKEYQQQIDLISEGFSSYKKSMFVAYLEKYLI